MVQSISILVVDDSDDFREMLGALLDAAGYEVVTAADGKRALRILETRAFDLIITDILMPEKDGLGLIESVHRSRPLLPIVAMSGGGHFVSDDYCEHSAYLLGASAFLHKPFASQKLLSTIDEMVGLVPAR